MTPQKIINTVGARIAKDLAEQAARPPALAAVEAGCRSDADVAAWVDRFRPAPLSAASARAAERRAG